MSDTCGPTILFLIEDLHSYYEDQLIFYFIALCFNHNFFSYAACHPISVCLQTE